MIRSFDAVRYPASYIRELSPAWLCYVAALSGRPAPDIRNRFRYLELGCGAGLSTLLHAAAFPDAEFHGCDVDGVAIEAAARGAAALGLRNVRLHRARFSELRAESLPMLDFVVLHGVYSWVASAEREAIHALIRNRLTAGGLAYVSYNCLPGWTAEVPLRRLFKELAAGHDGSTVERVQWAGERLLALAEPTLPYFQAHPNAGAACRDYAGSDAAYLAHELLADAWQPRYSVDVHDELGDAGLDPIGSATLADNHPELLLAEGPRRTLAGIDSQRLRILAEDVLMNRQLRRDVFVRTPAPSCLPPGSAVLGCAGTPESITPTIRVPRGEMAFDPTFIQAVQDCLLQGSLPVDAAVARLARGERDAAAVLRNLTYLVAGGAIAPFAIAAPVGGTDERPQFSSMAAALLVRALAESGAAGWVPGRLVGGGVRVTAVEARQLIDRVSGSGAREVEDALVGRMTRAGVLKA